MAGVMMPPGPRQEAAHIQAGFIIGPAAEVAKLKAQGAAPGLREGIVGLQGDGPVQGLERGAILLKRRLREAELGQRLVIVGPGGEHPPVSLYGRLGLSRAGERRAAQQ